MLLVYNEGRGLHERIAALSELEKYGSVANEYEQSNQINLRFLAIGQKL